MQLRRFAFSLWVLALFALSSAGQPSLGAETPAGKTTARDVSRKADETARAVKSYTVQQRDEAVRHAKTALDDIDARIRGEETKVDRDWDKMDAAARKRARAALTVLHRERNQVAEWYGGLKHGSAETWEQVKDGFVDSYETLKRSFAKARKDL